MSFRQSKPIVSQKPRVDETGRNRTHRAAEFRRKRGELCPLLEHERELVGRPNVVEGVIQRDGIHAGLCHHHRLVLQNRGGQRAWPQVEWLQQLASPADLERLRTMFERGSWCCRERATVSSSCSSSGSRGHHGFPRYVRVLQTCTAGL